MDHYRFTRTCVRGLLFLKKSQTSEGSFPALIFSDDENYSNNKESPTIFHTSLILELIGNLSTHHQNFENISSKSIRFLLGQKSNRWSFNYWNRTSKQTITEPYPDDLDDTFVALSAIQNLFPEIVDESVLISILELLVDAEQTIGGPYYTWIIHNYQGVLWSDVDLVVNSNIHHFLQKQSVILPNLVHFIDAKIVQNCFSSKYYHSQIITIYFLSRSYRGNYTSKLLSIIKKNVLNRIPLGRNFDQFKTEPVPNILETSAGLSAWIRLGGKNSKIRHAMNYLIYLQNRDGSWECCPAYIEQVSPTTTWYSGSPSLTTAFALETLHLFQENLKSNNLKDVSDTLLESVCKFVQKTIESFPITIQNSITSELKKIINEKHFREMVLLPYKIYQSEHPQKTLIPESIIEICSAGLLGWIGYSLQDHIIDQQASNQLLPIAHLCTQLSWKLFFEHAPNYLQPHVEKIFQDIEIANYWEQSHDKILLRDSLLILPKKLPDYGDYKILAQKSLGCTIGPMMVTQHIPNNIIQDFFIHHLIVRQILDDAHDWIQDLERGYLNSVSTLIIQTWQELHPEKHNTSLSFSETREAWINLFWSKTFYQVITILHNHLDHLRKILGPFSQEPSYLIFHNMLIDLEYQLQTIIRERNRTEKFIRLYSGRPRAIIPS